MTFDELESKYYELKGKHAGGLLSDEEFLAEVEKLSLQDSQGRWWMIGAKTGKWYVSREGEWVQAEPPRAAPSAERGCPNCGAPVKEDALFCASCGYRLVAEPAAPSIRAPQRSLAARPRGRGSCLFSLITGAVIGLIAVGSISLVAFNFFPDLQLEMGQGDLSEILTMGGGGLLISILGLLMLNGGFKAIITRRAIVEDDWGRRREKRGCSAVINGLGRLFFGILLLSGGLGMMTMTFYQEVLPWLGL